MVQTLFLRLVLQLSESLSFRLESRHWGHVVEVGQGNLEDRAAQTFPNPGHWTLRLPRASTWAPGSRATPTSLAARLGAASKLEKTHAKTFPMKENTQPQPPRPQCSRTNNARGKSATCCSSRFPLKIPANASCKSPLHPPPRACSPSPPTLTNHSHSLHS